MQNPIIIANWKSHKNLGEAKNFLEQFQSLYEKNPYSDKTVVICPPFTALSVCRSFLSQNNLPLYLGAQNVSAYPEGAYTGEVNAKQIKELCEYVIIGHSERRQNLSEKDIDLGKKVEAAKSEGLQVIFCVQNENTPIPAGVDIVAYEPVSAIGTGNAESPEGVKMVLQKIHASRPEPVLLYGGSVNEGEVKNYAHIEEVSGFLVGGASLDADSFFSIISSC